MSVRGNTSGNYFGQYFGPVDEVPASIGIRGMQAFWMGGAGNPGGPPPGSAGFRSMQVFWMGGAADGGGTPPDPGIVDWIIRARRHCIR